MNEWRFKPNAHKHILTRQFLADVSELQFHMTSRLSAVSPVSFQADGACPNFHGECARVPTHVLQSGPQPCGPMAWPPRSPDLTASDFFLWGLLSVKYSFHVYDQITKNYMHELQARLQNSFHICFITTGKLFIIGGIFVLPENTLRYISDR
jgi:hypothetical protein